MKNITVASGDGHMSAPLDEYKPYLEKKYHPDLEALKPEDQMYRDIAAKPRRPKGDELKIFDFRGALGEGELGDNGEAGSFNVDVRLKEMDAEGIAAEVIHYGDQCNIPPFFGTTNNIYTPELRFAGARAYNRKCADNMLQANGRLGFIAELGPCHDMNATLKEVDWVSKNGLVGVTVPGSPADPSLPKLTDPYWEPLWSAVAEAGQVLSVHAGWGQEQGSITKFFKMMNDKGLAGKDASEIEAMMMNMEDSPFILDTGPRLIMWQLMVAGVFDRHPSLKLALTEIRADWIPSTLQHLDSRMVSDNIRLALKPSEYFHRHCIVTPSSIRASEIALRHDIGVDRLCFGSDYPHYEGTWPNSRDWYKAAFAGVPENEARMILGENMLNWYAFDKEHINSIGQKIGPSVEEVIGGEVVTTDLINHFNKRAGYLHSPEDVNLGAIDKFVDNNPAISQSA